MQSSRPFLETDLSAAKTVGEVIHCADGDWVVTAVEPMESTDPNAVIVTAAPINAHA